MAKNCVSLNPECQQLFIRLEEKLDRISASLEKHIQGSEQRQDKFNSLSTDVAIIKSELKGEKNYIEKTEKNSQWRIGLTMGLIMTVVSISVNLLMKFLS